MFELNSTFCSVHPRQAPPLFFGEAAPHGHLRSMKTKRSKVQEAKIASGQPSELIKCYFPFFKTLLTVALIMLEKHQTHSKGTDAN